jgi:hypothetical protein
MIEPRGASLGAPYLQHKYCPQYFDSKSARAVDFHPEVSRIFHREVSHL